MDPNDFLNLIENRRSIREWLDCPVEEWKIEKVLEAGLHAPSAANTQKTRLYVLRDPPLISNVAKNTSPWFQTAYPKVIILVLFDLGKHDPQELNYLVPHPAWSRFIWQDTACAMMNMMLMAEALDLKTCWVSVMPDSLGEQHQNIRKLLNLHPRYILTCMLFLGYSNIIVDVQTHTHSGQPIKRNPAESILTTLTT